jgi:hypothetical protein
MDLVRLEFVRSCTTHASGATAAPRSSGNSESV